MILSSLFRVMCVSLELYLYEDVYTKINSPITYMLFTLKFQKKAQIVLFICSRQVLSKCSILKKDTSYWNQKKKAFYNSIHSFVYHVVFTQLSTFPIILYKYEAFPIICRNGGGYKYPDLSPFA